MLLFIMVDKYLPFTVDQIIIKVAELEGEASNLDTEVTCICVWYTWVEGLAHQTARDHV